MTVYSNAIIQDMLQSNFYHLLESYFNSAKSDIRIINHKQIIVFQSYLGQLGYLLRIIVIICTSKIYELKLTYLCNSNIFKAFLGYKTRNCTYHKSVNVNRIKLKISVYLQGYMCLCGMKCFKLILVVDRSLQILLNYLQRFLLHDKLTFYWSNLQVLDSKILKF